MQLGDLIFTENTDAHGIARIRHVMLYLGTTTTKDAMLIESTGSDLVKEKGARVVTAQAIFGVKNLLHVKNGDTLTRYEHGQVIGPVKIYCGTYLDPEHLQERRTALIAVN
jgi:hypothetical protein